MARPLITSVLTPGELARLRALPFPLRNKVIQDKLNMRMKAKAAVRRERERRELMRLRAGRIRNTDRNFAF